MDRVSKVCKHTGFAVAGSLLVGIRSVLGEMRHTGYFITNLEPYFAAIAIFTLDSPH
jgi:hypothetical protein